MLIVNGIPVHKQELKWSMEKKIYIVKEQLAKEYKISKKDISWDKTYGEKTAFEYLLNVSIQDVGLIKIQQKEAKERDLIDKINYKDFKKDWQTENKLRAEKIANNQIVYGPSQYEEKQYYEYIMNNLVIELKNYMRENELDITNKQINQVYNLNKDYFLNEPLDQVKNNVELLIVNQHYEDQITRAMKGAQINYINEKGIREIKTEWGK